MNRPAFIVGAGLAGLTAGYAFPGAPIREAAPRAHTPHRAVLRFRTDALSRLTGIPFRPVRVHKGIWANGGYRAPDISIANRYAIKCLGAAVGDRSIWRIDPVDRWVAPEDLLERMLDHLSGRVAFESPFDFARWVEVRRSASDRRSIISTAPLNVALSGALGVELPLARAAIWTRRYRVHGADAHQTVYFPEPHLATYRASLTGDLLIIEQRANLSPADAAHEAEVVLRAMALEGQSVDPVDSGEQRYGKIMPLPQDERRAWLARLTMEAGVLSLGRFATWRNVLLDDVVQDCDVIRRMLAAPQSTTNFVALRAAAGR